ncbi:MAG TPA: D-alanine--D-alanine ligase family protein [Thermodesulfobacteriota bacterium]|nr:D-alanine--D-alanine ligase family protein [Thermodesulfobacteriota bacterium]
MTSRKLTVAVLFGGRSGEHEVSLESAACVMEAIDRRKYDVLPIGITREGRWIASGDPLAALRSGQVNGHQQTALLPGDPTAPGLIRLPAAAPGPAGPPAAGAGPVVQRIDVVFPVLHGPYGEDGTVQGLLELAGIPYVGSGVLGSAVGMDKLAMKRLFQHAGLPLVPYLAIRKADWARRPAELLEQVGDLLGFPVFVKPANLGSSVGITKVGRAAELEGAIALAFQYDRTVLVEEGLEVREIECGVLGNDDPEVSVVGEVVPRREWYDYEAKYTPGLAEVVIPAPLPPALAEAVREMSLRAFRAIDAAGLARVDFFLDKRSGQLYVSEINTMPGFTRTSMYPKLWAASGLDYPSLVDRLIALALERGAERRALRTTR